MKINRCYPAAIVQAAFLTIVSARAQNTTTDASTRAFAFAATAKVRSEAVPLNPRSLVVTAEFAAVAGVAVIRGLAAQNASTQRGDYNECPGAWPPKVTTALPFRYTVWHRSLRLCLHQNNHQTYENNFILFENCPAFIHTGNSNGCPESFRGYLFVDKLPIRHRRCSAAYR